MAKESSDSLNFVPSTIFAGDNLHMMRGMNSECLFRFVDSGFLNTDEVRGTTAL